MREPMAENRFLLTKALFTEGMLRVWQDSGARSVKKLMALLGLLWLALAAVTLWQGGGPAMPLTELLVLVLVILWMAIFLPRSKTRRAYRDLEARGAADTERITRFYEDHLEVETPGTQTSLAYDHISRILPGKNLLILVSVDKTGILIKRDSYLFGSEEEILRRIREVKEENTND